MIRPARARHGGPPEAHRLGAADAAGKRHLANPVRPRRQPEMPLGADHAGQVTVQRGMDAGGVERRAGVIDEGGDAVFLGLGGVVGETVQLLGPHRVQMGSVEFHTWNARSDRQALPF